jgi:hypothetical protein
MPPGLRFADSNSKYDPNMTGSYRESHLFHLDYHETSLVYVIVLLRDVTMESGPFSIPRRVRNGRRKFLAIANGVRRTG